jgi:hypothetical protein
MEKESKMKHSHSIPSTLRDLLSKLEFLGMITPGKKPCMNTMHFVDGDTLWGAVQRAFGGESHHLLIAHIQQIIEQTIEAIEEYYSSEFLPIIVSTLYKAKIGIVNLKTTYQNKPPVIMKLNVILANINHQLQNHKDILIAQTKPVKTKNTLSHH